MYTTTTEHIMTINLQNYSVCKVHSFVKNYYVPTILKNHVYDMTTGMSLCGSVNMNHDRYDVEECDEVVECKACAKAFAKIKTAAAEAETVEAEMETNIPCATDTEHIISELSQAAQILRYVQATCENDEQYINILTVAECNELDEMFERLKEITTVISA